MHARGRLELHVIVGSIVAALACAVLLAAEPAPAQKTFATPEEAAEALVSAAERFDVPALKEILGPAGIDLVVTEDPVQDKNHATEFAANAREKMKVVMNAGSKSNATLVTGSDDWPMPIPIVRTSGRWRFDSKSGRQEILYRRIGRNELDAIDICRGYVEAQHEYALERHDGSLVNQYAQRVISSPGKRDGLVWRGADGRLEGPVAETIANAIAEGYTDRREPYHGYYFKVLKGQGPSAPHGAIDYMVGGAMIGGFALVAAPAEYRVTGVKTFIVSHDGVVHEKDLGPDTLAKFRAMTLYDPDKTWSPVASD